ncbi:MAG: hypothetical protein WD424_08325 [Paenibacillaceae bacterium]
MKVLWILPDDSTIENTIVDIEQLMFLLRLVNGVSINGLSYQLHHTELMMEKENISMSILLK